ncbi:MAG TPA: 50S ribosomal protein L4, partial [Cyanobacteria bacterium UBA12227]|nr:50S ribosomal protein L4 [Cyanobacteria bacterium UBA12227]
LINIPFLLILPELSEMVYLSARNVPTLKLICANNLNIYDILVADKIVTTNTALAKIQEVYND